MLLLRCSKISVNSNTKILSIEKINTAYQRRKIIEKIINIHIKKLPDGVYLATSKDIQGLVAQGRTATEALEIARDVARKLIEAQAELSGKVYLSTIDDSFDYPLIVNA
jgi:predicted RNase H-like HicB family nuclease